MLRLHHADGSSHCACIRRIAETQHTASLPLERFSLVTLCGLSLGDPHAPSALAVIGLRQPLDCSRCASELRYFRTETSIYLRGHDGTQAHRRPAAVA